MQPSESPSESPFEPAARRSLRYVKLGTIAAVAIGMVVAQRFGLFDVFSEPARIKQELVQLGPWGYVAFVSAYAAFQPFGVPGTIFILAAPLIWQWPVAFALSMTGTMAASVVGFSFARFVARDWIAKLVPARFHAYDQALEKRALFTVFMLRFIFWMPPMLHVFFGISRVPFWTHFWGSLAGYCLPLLATAYFGEKVFQAMRNAPPWALVGLVVVFVTIVVSLFVTRRSPPKVIT